MKTISRIDAVKMILASVAAANISGLRDRDRTEEQDARSGTMFFRWERAWAVGCDLDVTIDGRHGVGVRIGWSSTGRSPAAARASVVLYSAVTDLACLIEAQLSGFTIGD